MTDTNTPATRSAAAPTNDEIGVDVDHLFRHHSGRMVSSLVRALGWQHIELVEEAVQESFLAALRTWPFRGVPRQPAAWLTRVARNHALDQLRRASNWTRKRELLQRETTEAAPGLAPAEARGRLGEASREPTDEVHFSEELVDDSLSMVLACCHPQLSRDQQVALTLKTVGGFVVGEIARAFLTKPTTVAQRIVRAKAKLKELDEPLRIPPPDDLEPRLDAALEVIYLMFNEGYDSTVGDNLVRQDLCAEALRLVTLLARHPSTSVPQTHALAALLCLQASRFSQRTDARGELLLLESQDRSRWDHHLVSSGLQHLRRSASGSALSTYHLQAEIAALHATAPSLSGTNWSRIYDAYEQLELLDPSPVVRLHRLIALAMARGARAALSQLEDSELERRLECYYPLFVARGRFRAELGDLSGAERAYRRAQELAGNATVRAFLQSRIELLRARADSDAPA